MTDRQTDFFQRLDSDTRSLYVHVMCSPFLTMSDTLLYIYIYVQKHTVPTPNMYDRETLDFVIVITRQHTPSLQFALYPLEFPSSGRQAVVVSRHDN